MSYFGWRIIHDKNWRFKKMPINLANPFLRWRFKRLYERLFRAFSEYLADCTCELMQSSNTHPVEILVGRWLTILFVFWKFKSLCTSILSISMLLHFRIFTIMFASLRMLPFNFPESALNYFSHCAYVEEQLEAEKWLRIDFVQFLPFSWHPCQ